MNPNERLDMIDVPQPIKVWSIVEICDLFQRFKPVPESYVTEAHHAALRTRLEAEVKERIRYALECDELKQRLAQVEQEQDQWKSWCNQTPSADCMRQLATAQAQIDQLNEFIATEIKGG